MKLDTTRPIRLAPCDVAAIVGKLETARKQLGGYPVRREYAEARLAIHESLRVLSHAQTPDYSANLETPDGKDCWGPPYRPSKGRLDRPGEE